MTNENVPREYARVHVIPPAEPAESEAAPDAFTASRDELTAYLADPAVVPAIVRRIAHSKGWAAARPCAVEVHVRAHEDIALLEQDPTLRRRDQRERHPHGTYFTESHFVCRERLHPKAIKAPVVRAALASAGGLVDVAYEGSVIRTHCPLHGRQTLGVRRWREALDCTEGWVEGAEQSIDIGFVIATEPTPVTDLLWQVAMLGHHHRMHAWAVLSTFAVSPRLANLATSDGVILLRPETHFTSWRDRQSATGDRT